MWSLSPCCGIRVSLVRAECSVCGACAALSVVAMVSIPCSSMTSDCGQTAFTRKGPRLRVINFLHALSAVRVAPVVNVAVGSGLSMYAVVGLERGATRIRRSYSRF